MESSQEAEFEENEFLYDDIEGLEEVSCHGDCLFVILLISEFLTNPHSNKPWEIWL